MIKEFSGACTNPSQPYGEQQTLARDSSCVSQFKKNGIVEIGY